MKSCRILYWKAESAQKVESAKESGICTKKQNLHKKVESAQKAEYAQESGICTMMKQHNAEEKHLAIR